MLPFSRLDHSFAGGTSWMEANNELQMMSAFLIRLADTVVCNNHAIWYHAEHLNCLPDLCNYNSGWSPSKKIDN
jgi:hypothetical protein